MSNQLTTDIDKIVPEDIINALESGYRVFRGEQEHFEDMVKHGSSLLRKISQRFTPVQIIVGIAVLASVAVVAVSKTAQILEDNDDE
ncbi:hypothetical protein [Hymenobacter psychrophilus]|uniref:Recombination associated protein RdgC n=1 Tax=Hymenobacter psychrophilus TaxID=651662 RepID=A0A1H3JEY5_9BACT|nr:hypothetical protein [Hymenobacter psychrophilus]SDY38590.1 recombination associated protein RdgC [Hymenobacter psychrophilus]